MNWTSLVEELDKFLELDVLATFWFRDDGAVRLTPQLERFTEVMNGVPFALSVMPFDASNCLADFVKLHSNISVIQYGRIHNNLEDDNSENRETSVSTNFLELFKEFSDGKFILNHQFGNKYFSIFVPPLGDISVTHLPLLMQAGIPNLSIQGEQASEKFDDVTISNIHCGPLKCTPPHSFDSLSLYLEQIISHLRNKRLGVARQSEVTGIGTHHLAQSKESLDFLQTLISILKNHKAVKVLNVSQVFDMNSDRASDAHLVQIPHFLISYNRHEYLEAFIRILRNKFKQNTIVVHDNGSDDENTIAYLQSIELSGVIVYRYPKINSAGELNKVNDSVETFFSGKDRVNYVVSDCDIDLSICSENIYSVLTEFLEVFPNVEIVGPMLKINDIPFTYALYNHVMNLHIEQFWKKTPEIFNSSFGQVAYQFAPIDTTFGIHRGDSKFARLKNGIRLYSPYEARHLDWYIGTPRALGISSSYSENSSADVSHWNNTKYSSNFSNSNLIFDSYIAVRTIKNKFEFYVQKIYNYF